MSFKKYIHKYFAQRQVKNTNTDILRTSIIIEVPSEECTIKMGIFYEDNTSSNMASAFVKHFSNDTQAQIVCAQILVTKKILGNDYRFVSPIIRRDKKNIELLLERNNGLKIYVVSSDYLNYYFDLDFLYPPFAQE